MRGPIAEVAQPRLRGVRLLVADPELAEGLTPAEAAAATQALVAPIVELKPGEERLLEAEPDASRGLLGLLVLGGMMLREVTVPGTTHAELVGEGDLLLPGGAVRGWAPAGLLDSYHDERHLAGARTLLHTQAQVALRRGHDLAWQSAIRNQTRVDHRIHRLLWHYADRWGRVTPDGVSVELPLTHECIGKLVGAHRPSVTSAIGMLERGGLLNRPSHGTWLLTRPEPAQATPLRRSASNSRPTSSTAADRASRWPGRR